MTSHHQQTFGEFLREARMKRGLSERDVATAVGYQRGGTIRRIENGHLPFPMEKSARFADALGIAHEKFWENLGAADNNARNKTPAADSLPRSVSARLARMRRKGEFWKRIQDGNREIGEVGWEVTRSK